MQYSIKEEANFLNENLVQNVMNNRGLPLLTEERGVGASREYLDIVKAVVDYVADTIKYGNTFNGKKECVLKIPQSICKRFDRFSSLEIKVTVKDIGELSKIHTGGGHINIPLFTGVYKDKLSMPVVIYLSSYSNGDTLERRTVAEPLIHELNHARDTFERLNGAGCSYNPSSPMAQADAYHIIEGKVSPQIGQIIYRLFSSTEVNALISSVYGDLSSINSKREYFKDHIRLTGAYNIYLQLLDIVKMIEEDPDDFQEDFETLIQMFATDYRLDCLNPMPHCRRHPDIATFRKAFVEKAYKSLNAILRGIGRVASYYYDVTEEGSNPATIE